MRRLIPAISASLLFVLFFVLVKSSTIDQSHHEELADPFASTFSIVGIDPANGDLGVAVQSKFPNVRPIVPWAAAGVGAVATQSFINVSYGPKGLALLRN